MLSFLHLHVYQGALMARPAGSVAKEVTFSRAPHLEFVVMTDSGLGIMTRCAEVISWECISISIAHFQADCALFSNQGQVHNLSYENEFYLHVNETRFHMNGYAPKLPLRKRSRREHENGLLSFADLKASRLKGDVDSYKSFYVLWQSSGCMIGNNMKAFGFLSLIKMEIWRLWIPTWILPYALYWT